MYITSKELIANIKDSNSIPDSYNSRIKRWIYDGMFEIDKGRIYVKRVILDMPGRTVDLPKGCIAVNKVQLMDGSGNCCTPRSDRSMTCCKQQDCPDEYTVTQNIDELCFSDNVDKFPKVFIEYYTPLLDDNGDPLVPRAYSQALDYYVNYMYLRKKRNDGRKIGRNNPVPQSELSEARSLWAINRRKARTRKVGPTTPNQLAQLGDAFIYEMSNDWPKQLLTECRKYFNSL